MKITFVCLTSAIVGFALGSTAFGGDPKAPMVEDPACAVPFYGSVSAGYDTSYLFRGGRYGDHAPWAGIDLNYDINDTLTWNFGTWYINPTQGPFVVNDELDVYSYLYFPLAGFDAAIGGTWFYFPEGGGDAGEVNLALTRSIGGLFDFTFDYVYDITFEGHYFGYYADKTIPLANCLDLNLGTGISHATDNYNFRVLAGDHAYVQAGLTFHLTESADFSTYILGNFPYNDLEAAGEENDVYGGASISVSF